MTLFNRRNVDYSSYTGPAPTSRGTFLMAPHRKDYNILGLYLGVPLFMETTSQGFGSAYRVQG